MRLVVDASVLVNVVGDDERAGLRARERIVDRSLIAPEIIDLEVVQAIRRAARTGRVDGRRSKEAIQNLIALPIRRLPHLPLIGRIWELRDNVSPYDAAYVALAEGFGVPLLTADARLARASGIRCEVELLS